jgi:hypothetical protein
MVMEDWLFHVTFPFVAYGVLLIAGASLARAARLSLFVVAGTALGLLFVGIHNAWDTATYLTVDNHRKGKTRRDSKK